ncbi:hypothetical protein [[Phormidium] sp. LEGE 05292]|nr:hypothetical protein [Phormidium sp. LEGE 05292]
MTPLKVFHQEQENAGDRSHYTNSLGMMLPKINTNEIYTKIAPSR